jgi:hypothetical protein
MQKKQFLFLASLVVFTLSYSSTAQAAGLTVAAPNSSMAEGIPVEDLSQTSLPEAPTMIVATILLVLPFSLCAVKSFGRSRTSD